MQLLFTVLFILGLAFQSFVDACSRKSPRPVVDHSKSTTAATVSSSSSSSTTTFKPVPPNRFNCTEEQISSTSCLNGGVCFSMMLGGSKASACKCPAKYTGLRCEALAFHPVKDYTRLRIAGIAAGITSCILVLILVMCVIFVYIKYRDHTPLMPTNSQNVHD
ncbi:CAE1282272.1unnamed protein product [Octopus vulgaris]|uniref:CAE1282272.1unnamed protein product n=1 Tax=Octopus vulgaris TaxID=6645 RepID=A0AA36FIQ9_OCTVU|nr:CAE1282272.1unnamed protein product [Octopus vulgaris]